MKNGTSKTDEPSANKSELPPGFISQLDPATGRTFYVNTANGKSQWTYPLEKKKSINDMFASLFPSTNKAATLTK